MIDNKDIEKLGDIFVTKEDIKVFATKDDLVQLKDEVLSGQDAIIGKLDMILQEKIIGDEQGKRQKKVLEIHNNSLKRSKILSKEEISKIGKLQIFLN